MTRQARGSKAFKNGHMAETIAALWLRIKGYRILERRYRTPVGEIDLIARRGRVIAFVEVKLRPDLDAALHAVSPMARARITRTAEWYGQKHGGPEMIRRFDLVAICPWRFPHHLENAWGHDI